MSDVDVHAKRPISAALAGPYGHPFHPMLVTVPIGAWISSFVLDIGSHVVDDGTGLATGATWLLAIGVLGALAAASVGFLDFLAIPSGTAARRTAVVHMSINLTVTVAFVLNFAWRYGDADGSTPWGPIVLSLVALGGLGVSGYLGGKLAYRYGVRVAAESVQAEGFTGAPGHASPNRSSVES